MTANSEKNLGILLSDDLIFTSRIVGAAQSHGFRLLTAKSASDLIKVAEREAASCIILDLALLTPDVETTVERLGPGGDAPFIVAYGSHVDVETLKKAREAGCDVVLPRSKFVEELETALPSWFDKKKTSES